MRIKVSPIIRQRPATGIDQSLIDPSARASRAYSDSRRCGVKCRSRATARFRGRERQHARALNAVFVAQVCDSVRGGLPPVIWGDGSEVHDYLYVVSSARRHIDRHRIWRAGLGCRWCRLVRRWYIRRA